MANQQQFARHCIFCDARGVSKEHVYADWMRDFLPDHDRTSHRLVRRARDPATGLPSQVVQQQGMMQKSGAPRSRKLQVVCASCNSSWMSSLQTDAKPRLLPKLRGDWHYMTRQDQAALSTWACMFTMVYERADPDYAAIDARERQRFCRYKAPSDEWRIWVGRGDDYLASQNLAIHRGMTEPGDVKPDAEKVAQITISAPGKFVFLTLYSRSDRLRHSFFDWSFDEAAKGAGLLRIWPPQSRPIFESPVPPNTISEPAMDALIERFTEIFRMQVAWL